MSLILDALRKSEAERRRGQSPDLFSTSSIALPASRPGLRWWPVAVFVVLLLASAWVVWDGRTQRAPDDVTPPNDVAAAGAAASADDDAADAAAADGAARRCDRDAARFDRCRSAACRGASGDDRACGSHCGQFAGDRKRFCNTARARKRRHRTRVPESACGRSRRPCPRYRSSHRPPKPPADEALPSLAVLDSITRGTLPPLKLSMHVWGQEPGKRFAIVDGQRVAEGALLGNGVVEQIRRDGVVINVNGQRLLLPKP